MNMHDFIAQVGITMAAKPAASNPNMPDSDDMNHWKCTLAAGRSRMTLIFSMGTALLGPPKPEEVLNCLASDSAASEENFQSWCWELGYDSDSRKAERIYNVCRRQAVRLEHFLGDSAYETLLYKVEGL